MIPNIMKFGLEKLQCTVPIQLSDRKLFTLDIADLIHRVRAKTESQHVSDQAIVCNCQEDDDRNPERDNGSKSIDIKETGV